MTFVLLLLFHQIVETAQSEQKTLSIPVLSDKTPLSIATENTDVKQNNETDEDKLKDTATPSVDHSPQENIIPSAKQQKNIFTSNFKLCHII